MTGEKGGLLAGLRAEALKSRHAAPVRLAVLMALPMPLLGAMPYRGVQIFSAWNYWYALFLPVALSLVVACVASMPSRAVRKSPAGIIHAVVTVLTSAQRNIVSVPATVRPCEENADPAR